jgi:hypothetical protein
MRLFLVAIAVFALAPHCQHVGLVNCTTTTPSELDVEEAAAGSVVRFEMVVAGIDFAGLTSDVTLRDEFIGTIKEGIRSSLEEINVLTSHIDVTLQAGSVKVTSTITPPSGTNVNALSSGLNINLVQDLSIIEVLISGVSGIAAVKTGAISITGTEAIVVLPDTGGSASTCQIWGCDGPIYLVVGGIFLGCLCCCQATYFLLCAKSLVPAPAAEGAEGEAAAAEVAVDSDGMSAEKVESQFEIHQGKNTLTQCNAHTISDPSDILRCQQLCLEREYGAFVLCRGEAQFKGERAEVCEQGLFDDKEATTYLVAEFSF